jgi:hypothetical protein
MQHKKEYSNGPTNFYCLLDSTLSFFSLPFFDPIPSSFIQPIKGVSCFSHDIGEEGRIGEDGTVELSVIKRRTIQIYKIGESMHLKKVSLS